MKKCFILILLAGVLQLTSTAQAPTADSVTKIRIVDSLSQQDKSARNVVLLKSELDSIIAVYLPVQTTVPDEKAETGIGFSDVLTWLSISALVAIVVLLYLLWAQQKKSTRSLIRLYKQVQHLDSQVSAQSSLATASQQNKKKAGPAPKDLSAAKEELERLQEEIQRLETMILEYQQVKQDYEGLKQQMLETYKVRHYPGYSKDRSETEILQSLVRTEKSVAQYAFDHFLKPVIQITDANKNHPAKMSEEDQQQVVDCLVSMGLLYSEYLYLRISELSVGGKMVERIGSLRKGNAVDSQSLKELNTDHGSRALALRMALNKMGVGRLSYPVFEETNLNLS